ncbi:hypothetical protein [Actinomadura sp. 9N407]|uniref:hypothetical protein n=1 Tax=Actinomadura sp. 9N407 TaxID=3375154 RepID=UPI0037B9BF82
MSDLPPPGAPGGPGAPSAFPGVPGLPPLPSGGAKPPRENYSGWTRDPVVHLPVLLRGREIGRLWASKTRMAAGFLRLPEVVDEVWDALVVWSDRLHEDYAKGLPALEAVERWRGVPEDPAGGGVPADAEAREAPSLAALYALIDPANPPPPGPLIQDGTFPDGTPADRSQGWGPLISSAPPTYARETGGPIRYVPVMLRDTVAGYLWASADGRAAGYLERAAAGEAGQVAGGLWRLRLSRAFAAGVPAFEALRRCRESAADELSGVIGPEAREQDLPDLAALRELARR